MRLAVATGVAGLSGSQMIAVWSARLTMWRSMQLALTLVVPSSNHLIETAPFWKEVFFTLVKGLIQSMRRPSVAQKASGLVIEVSYRWA